MKGVFISFEGIEGAGKSTQIKLLSQEIEVYFGLQCITTREPGGTEVAEKIRPFIVKGEVDSLSSVTEALLSYAARDDHLRRVIRPALQRGEVVITDRFIDSTRAYQAFAGDCPFGLIDALENYVVGETIPDKTIIIDIEPEVALERKLLQLKKSSVENRGENEDRIERKGLDFQHSVRKALLQIASDCPERCVVIDATKNKPKEHVAADIWHAVRPLLEQHLGMMDSEISYADWTKVWHERGG